MKLKKYNARGTLIGSLMIVLISNMIKPDALDEIHQLITYILSMIVFFANISNIFRISHRISKWIDED